MKWLNWIANKGTGDWYDVGQMISYIMSAIAFLTGHYFEGMISLSAAENFRGREESA